MQFSGKTLFSDLYKILSTLSIAFISAQIFLALNVPAPYFLGSLLGVWVIGACVSHTRRVLVIPGWFYLPVIIGISVLIGTNFTPEILESAQMAGHRQHHDNCYNMCNHHSISVFDESETI